MCVPCNKSVKIRDFKLSLITLYILVELLLIGVTRKKIFLHCWTVQQCSYYCSYCPCVCVCKKLPEKVNPLTHDLNWTKCFLPLKWLTSIYISKCCPTLLEIPNLPPDQQTGCHPSLFHLSVGLTKSMSSYIPIITNWPEACFLITGQSVPSSIQKQQNSFSLLFLLEIISICPLLFYTSFNVLWLRTWVHVACKWHHKSQDLCPLHWEFCHFLMTVATQAFVDPVFACLHSMVLCWKLTNWANGCFIVLNGLIHVWLFVNMII